LREQQRRPRVQPEMALVGIASPALGLCCGSLCSLARDLVFGAEPVVEVVPVLAAAGLVELICTAADHFFKILARLGCEGFCRSWRTPMLLRLMLLHFFGKLLLFGS